MEILNGSKRDIAFKLWTEQIEKYVKKIDNDEACLRRFNDEYCIDWMIEDCESLLKTLKNTKDMLKFAEENNIEQTLYTHYMI